MLSGHLRRSLLASVMSSIRFTLLAAACSIPMLLACDQGGPPTCDCPTKPPACAGCPPVAEELCIDGACVARGDDVAEVSADVSIQRGLEGVVGVTLAVIDGREATCASLLPLAEQANIIAGTRLDVSGGPFHPAVPFGATPAGPVLLAAEGLDTSGAVVGRGCIAGTVIAGKNALGVVTIAP